VRRAVRPITALCVMLFLAVAVLPAAAQPFGALARVLPHATEADTRGDEVTLRLGLSQPVPFRVFALAEPWRVVVEFREQGPVGIAFPAQHRIDVLRRNSHCPMIGYART